MKISDKKKEKSKKMNRSIYTVSISDNKTKKKVGDSDSALAEKLIRWDNSETTIIDSEE